MVYVRVKRNFPTENSAKKWCSKGADQDRFERRYINDNIGENFLAHYNDTVVQKVQHHVGYFPIWVHKFELLVIALNLFSAQ